jgi:phosphotriesterase-related protein
MAKVETVRGPISPVELGVTLPHEHILIDLCGSHLSKAFDARRAALLDSPVSIKILGELRRSLNASKDNLKLSDVEVAVEELKLFKDAGGMSVIDVTAAYSEPPQRNPNDLQLIKEIAEKTELNIVLATGFYVKSSHPKMVSEKSIPDLAQLMVRDLTEGFEGTQIRAGVIGEIGCGAPLEPDEEKVLRAAAKAQKETNACIILHSGTFDPFSRSIAKQAASYLDVLEAQGADLSKVCVSHMDFTCSDLKYHAQILDRGASIMYDTFGCDFYRDDLWYGAVYPTDTQRIAGITELCKQGYDEQLLLSQDTCLKIQTVTYGGYGYAHILQHIIPCLRNSGVQAGHIQNMLISNPRKMFQM